VLVTGGARRIGRVIALAFAQRGWDVGIHYGRSRREAQATAREIESLGRRAALLQADLADEREVRALVPAAFKALGRLDCLVNNASRFEVDDAASTSYRSLSAHYLTNTAAPVLLARGLAARLPDDAQACVVNLLDQKLFNPNPDFLAYTLSKSALSADQSDDGFARAHAMTPLGRASTPEDVAAAVLFAAENRAITGSSILVDGGQHLLPTTRDIMFLTETQATGARPRNTSARKAAKK
jgi:NAD(P)-dependent dehydrogenase (short-subunit alcohol dehydrogenase family)